MRQPSHALAKPFPVRDESARVRAGAAGEQPHFVCPAIDFSAAMQGLERDACTQSLFNIFVGGMDFPREEAMSVDVYLRLRDDEREPASCLPCSPAPDLSQCHSLRARTACLFLMSCSECQPFA